MKSRCRGKFRHGDMVGLTMGCGHRPRDGGALGIDGRNSPAGPSGCVIAAFWVEMEPLGVLVKLKASMPDSGGVIMVLPRKLERHVRQRCPAEAGRRQGSRAEQRGVGKKEAKTGNRARRHAPTNGDVEITYLVEAVKVTLITLGSSGSGLQGDHCSLVGWESERPA